MRLLDSTMRTRGLALVLLVVTVAAALLTTELGYDFSPQALYASTGSDRVDYLEEFGASFGYDDSLILVLLESQGDDDVLHASALTWLRRIAHITGELPDVAGVYSVATLNAFWPMPPTATTTVTEADARGFRERIKTASLLSGLLVNRQRNRATTIVGMRADVRGVERMRPALAALLAAIDANGPPEGYGLRMTGMPVVRENVVQDLKHEQRSKLPIAALMFLIVMWVALGSLPCALLPLVGVGIGLVWTTGSLALLGERLNIIDNMMPIVLLVIGAANGIHVIHRYTEELHRTPDDHQAAFRRAMRRMALACLFTYGTTAIGFLSLTTARFNALQAVGWHMAMGLMLLYASTMTLMILFLHRLTPPFHDGKKRFSIERFLGRIGDIVTHHPVPVAAATLVLIGLSIWATTHLPIRTSILETYDEDHPVRETMRVVEEEFGGVLTVDVSFRVEDPAKLLQPALMEKVDRITKWAADHSTVALARSYVDLQTTIHERFFGKTPISERTVQQIKQVDAVARNLHETLRYHRFLTREGDRGRIMLRVPDAGSDVLLDFVTELEAEVKRADFSADEVTTRLTGLGYVYANALTGFIRDMLRSLGGAALVVFALIAFLFRSIRVGLISVLPNITPLLLTLGYMQLRGYDLNRASVIVFAIGLGVAVDDTIHFLVRYREESRDGGPVSGAVRRTLFGAGRAMVITTLLMVVGLAFIHTSDFMPTRRFAELTSVMMVAALIGDLCLLPALLVIFRRRGRVA